MALVATGALWAQGPAEHWVGTWSSAQTWRPALPPAPATTPAPGQPAPPRPIQFNNQTLRQIVHTAVGGDRVRVVFSNAFGTAPMSIGAAAVGVREKDSSIVSGSSKPLTFAGQRSATIPAGASLLSDPVALSFKPMSDLAVDVFFPTDTAAFTSPLTVHSGAYQTNYVSDPGNHAGETALNVSGTTASWFLITRVEVIAPPATAAIVAFGDSITDGTRSTIDTNRRWPDELFRRLQANAGTRNISIVNAAIAGNRLLSEANAAFGINALARFDRDVLAQPGAKWVVVLEGINDIGMSRPDAPPAADDLIAAYRQLIARAHAKGLKIFGATLTPYEGAAYYRPNGEPIRQAVNNWIRTSKAFDAVIDFDAAVRDPQNPTKILPAYNGGDNLHMSDAGYKAMADAVDLSLFK